MGLDAFRHNDNPPDSWAAAAQQYQRHRIVSRAPLPPSYETKRSVDYVFKNRTTALPPPMPSSERIVPSASTGSTMPSNREGQVDNHPPSASEPSTTVYKFVMAHFVEAIRIPNKNDLIDSVYTLNEYLFGTIPTNANKREEPTGNSWIQSLMHYILSNKMFVYTDVPLDNNYTLKIKIERNGDSYSHPKFKLLRPQDLDNDLDEIVRPRWQILSTYRPDSFEME